jgi:hypothetical protein
MARLARTAINSDEQVFALAALFGIGHCGH